MPKNFSEEEVTALLEQQGYTRMHARRDEVLEVVQDRFRMSAAERARVIEALEAALRVGQGRVNVHVGIGNLHPPPRGHSSFEGEANDFVLRSLRAGVSAQADEVAVWTFSSTSTAPTATSITRIRRPACSRSIRRSARARRAAASGA